MKEKGDTALVSVKFNERNEEITMKKSALEDRRFLKRLASASSQSRL
jgi:hypothetical protein